MTKGSFIIKSSIMNKRKFMRLSATSKTLYFYLNADADDDGIVDAAMTLQRSGLNDNDLTQLSPLFITLLDDEEGIVFINHWTKHNTGFEMRKHHRSEYFDLLVENFPTAKVFIGEPEFKFSKDGNITTQLTKKEVTAEEANLRANCALLSEFDAPNTTQPKLIEPKIKKDNITISPMLTSRYELLISRGISSSNAKQFAEEYTEDEIMRYISYTLLYDGIFDEVALLTAALRQKWNIGKIVSWSDCSSCHGSGWDSNENLPCCHCKGTGKLPIRKSV